MKLFLLMLLASAALAATPKTNIFALYQNGKYTEACHEGFKHLNTYQKDESFVSLYAFSCLQAENFERLHSVIVLLGQTAESRANASYFSLLLMQKQLLIQALYDQKILNHLKFPTSSHLLSKIFDSYMRDPQQSNFIKEYTDSVNPRQSYRLYPAEKNGKKTIAIDEYYDKILTAHHIY